MTWKERAANIIRPIVASYPKELSTDDEKRLKRELAAAYKHINYPRSGYPYQAWLHVRREKLNARWPDKWAKPMNNPRKKRKSDAPAKSHMDGKVGKMLWLNHAAFLWLREEGGGFQIYRDHSVKLLGNREMVRWLIHDVDLLTNYSEPIREKIKAWLSEIAMDADRIQKEYEE